jgi:hypothetical protein
MPKMSKQKPAPGPSQKITLVGECKWTVHPVCTNVLDDLKQKARVLTKDHEIEHVHFSIFARHGFTPDPEARSRSEGVGLFTVDSLVNCD